MSTSPPGLWLLVIYCLGLAIWCLGLAFGAAASPLPLFGTAEFRADSHTAIPQWRRALSAMAAERATYTACAPQGPGCPSVAVATWLELLARLEGLPERAQIEAVDRFVNAIPYQTDEVAYGLRDHWATPGEFLGRTGDCEDYAIAKYASLRRLGVPPDRLRIVVVEDVSRGAPHAVLAVATASKVLILDNLSPVPLPQDEVVHYRPYYSVNEDARWAHVPPRAVVVSAAALARPMATAAVDAVSAVR